MPIIRTQPDCPGSGKAALASARRALQEAARDLAQARAALPDDDGEAADLRPVVDARQWTVVDEFESNGEKYVVARESAPPAGELSLLTPAERSVVTHAARGSSTKEIAYELGISDATVRVLLMRAARRCGARGRKELLILCRNDAEESAYVVNVNAGDSRSRR